MTNPVTDATKNPSDKKKKTKAKGPLRLEAIIPMVILIGGVWAYAFFFLDGHLRKGLEYGASKIYGAQVDIHSVRISFFDPSFTVSGIEVTNKENPAQNAISIDKIRFALLWDALLRAKVVVDESSMTGIALLSPRKSPGEVYPPPPPEPSKGPGLTDKITDEIKAQAEAQLKNNIFGDVAKILTGGDATEQLKQLRDQLQSEAKIKEIQTSLNTKKDEWTKRINDLPKPDEVKALVDKVKSIKINTSNPMEAQKQLESLRKDMARVQEIVTTFQKGQTDIEKDLNGFNASLKQIDEAVRKDMEDLQGKFKLPAIDKDSMTKALLSKVMGDKMLKVVALMNKAKAYMPDRSQKKSSEKDEKPEFVPHARGKGRTYKFPVTVGYPLFWLKKSEISSKATPEGFSGDFSGKILDLTTDPAIIRKPTILELAGSAPKQEINDVAMKLVMDYRGEVGVTSMDMKVGSHPFPEQSFAKGEDITFGINKSAAALKAQASYQGGDVRATIDEVIDQPSFVTDAKAPLLKEALSSAIGRIKKLTMTVTLAGTFSSPKFGLDSNLGTELAAGLEQHLKAKLDEAKAKLKSFVDGRINGERAKLTAEVTKAQSAFQNLLKGKDSEFKNLQAELEKAYKDKSSAQTSKAKEQLKDKAKDALKKFGF